MEAKKVVETLARVETLSQNVIDSEKNANDLVDLLEYLNSDENIPLLKAVLQSLSRVYRHLVRKNYSWIVRSKSTITLPAAPVSNSALTERTATAVTQQYREWMRQNYLSYIEGLWIQLHHINEDVQWSSLQSLMSLVQSEGAAHQMTIGAYIFPNTLFHSFTAQLLDGSENRSKLIDRFLVEYLKYDDVRYYWLKNISSIISSQVDGGGQAPKVSQHFVKNCHCALGAVVMPSAKHLIGEFLSGNPPEVTRPSLDEDVGKVESDEDQRQEEEIEKPPKTKMSRRERKALNIRSLLKHRKQFSDAWLTFLRLPLTPSQCKHVLISMHFRVIPHLIDPRLLLDFFTLAYDEGGVVGLLALNGLFVLINEHHLDYPDFYNKLYLLLEPSVFHVKYMQRFFCLLDTFLKSTHLALYLVAAFAKKIARLSLTAPPNGVMVAAVFVTNLIKRHPNCQVLLHRQASREDHQSTSADPFDMCETEPAKCRALESCLWELKTLQSHYCPAVSTLIKHLLDPDTSSSKVESGLGKYLDIDGDQLFLEACTEFKSTDKVPLNFQEPTELW